VVAAALYVLYRARVTRPAASFFGAWSLIALAPESTLVPIRDIAVEYRMYLPSAGLIAAAAVIAGGMEVSRKAAGKAVAATVLAMLMVLTFSRNRVWASDYTLWSDVAAKAPHSARAHAALGMALGRQGRYADSIAELKKAVEADPSYIELQGVYCNMGKDLLQLGKVDEAADAFEAALKVDPGCTEAEVNMGVVYYRTGRYEEAARSYREAVRTNPGFAQAHLGLALAYRKLGLGRDALAEALTASRLSPGDFGARYALAGIYLDNGMRAESQAEAAEALGLAGDGQEIKMAQEMLDSAREGR